MGIPAKTGSGQATVGQGYEVGRSSELFLQGEDIDGKIDIRVGEKVVLIAKGE